VAALAGSHSPLYLMSTQRAFLSRDRLARLRQADMVVRELCRQSGFEDSVWQFPVILAPFGTPERPDSVVLRPIFSVDGMTASSVIMPAALLERMTARLLALDGISSVLYDMTHKPPGTIEWE
jgi:GMP synthase (glutamine-hydrolysing)